MTTPKDTSGTSPKTLADRSARAQEYVRWLEQITKELTDVRDRYREQREKRNPDRKS